MQCLCYKMRFICIRMKNHFHICRGFALRLTLKQRLEATQAITLQLFVAVLKTHIKVCDNIGHNR